MIAESSNASDSRSGLAGQIARAAFGQAGLFVTLLWTIPFFWVPFGLLLVYSFGTQDYLTARMSFGWTLESWRALYDPVVYGAFSFDVSGVYAASDPDTLDSDSLLGRVVALSVAQLNRN